ncbi:MAG TPA: DegT/DnrJ/EryC1/StrS family aminotransferase [Candidatus Krumholzibacteria bacterium]|nr:DegT/DnrJ/EryC1/StrS family aminotransferase [Candidatus Krumholzibacteria bacterium]
MSGLLSRVRAVARHQAAVGLRVVTGRRVSPFPLGSATLDRDDVEVACAWLGRDHEAHADVAPVARFEAEFARWNGSGAAFAFASGRESLSAIIAAMGLGAGDEVIVPGYTCVVVPNALEFAGVTPVYADIELDTYGLDVSQLDRHVTSRTRAILIHHLYGLVCRDYVAAIDFARARGLRVIEDCAQATGAALEGVRVGNRGDAAFYSLEQSKLLTTFQGGVAVAHDPQLAARIAAVRDAAPCPGAAHTRRVLRNLMLNYAVYKDPQRWWRGDWMQLRVGGEHIVTTTDAEMRGEKPVDYGARLPAALAEVGCNQLRKLDHYNTRRREHAARWDRWCDENGHARAHVVAGSTPVFLRYPVLVDPARKRDRSWARRTLGVELGVWFVSNLHPSPRRVEGCPNAAAAVERCINFPTLLGDRLGAE